jgi:tetratricopeptide (TPR) repeat protein
MVAEPAIEPLARLNLALGHLQLRDYETALKEHLPKIKMPGSRGICQGTVYYYMGLSYQRLGERADAARWYREALKYAEATLQSNDGPRVAGLAERRLREIGQ